MDHANIEVAIAKCRLHDPKQKIKTSCITSTAIAGIESPLNRNGFDQFFGMFPGRCGDFGAAYHSGKLFYPSLLIQLGDIRESSAIDHVLIHKEMSVGIPCDLELVSNT